MSASLAPRPLRGAARRKKTRPVRAKLPTAVTSAPLRNAWSCESAAAGEYLRLLGYHVSAAEVAEARRRGSQLALRDDADDSKALHAAAASNDGPGPGLRQPQKQGGRGAPGGGGGHQIEGGLFVSATRREAGAGTPAVGTATMSTNALLALPSNDFGDLPPGLAARETQERPHSSWSTKMSGAVSSPYDQARAGSVAVQLTHQVKVDAERTKTSAARHSRRGADGRWAPKQAMGRHVSLIGSTSGEAGDGNNTAPPARALTPKEMDAGTSSAHFMAPTVAEDDPEATARCTTASTAVAAAIVVAKAGDNPELVPSVLLRRPGYVKRKGVLLKRKRTSVTIADTKKLKATYKKLRAQANTLWMRGIIPRWPGDSTSFVLHQVLL